MTYDDWKATPPADDSGPDYVDQAMEEAGADPEALASELENIARAYPAMREKAEDAIRSLRGAR